MIRPAATEVDKAVFEDLLETISAVDSYFCCGGTLELTDRPFTLFYKSENQHSWLDFGNLHQQSEKDRQSAIEKLLQACVPAPHGRGDETVLDESYRLARELRHNEFAFSTDLLSEFGGDILCSIGALTAGRLVLLEEQAEAQEPVQKPARETEYMSMPESRHVPNLTMIPRLYKLNAYAKNGFFKPHRDTPKGKYHIGTLMIALPSAYEGGALRVSHDGKELVFDWHEQCSQGVQITQEGQVKMTFPWAFLFSDVEHEVLDVESGTRITIAYDIFSSQVGAKDMAGSIRMDPTVIPLYENLVSASRNPLFLSQGAEVAIALSHSYPLPRTMKLTDEEFATGLKGLDAVVYRAMKAAGFDVSLRAVLPQILNHYSEDGDDPNVKILKENIPQDGYGPNLSPRAVGRLDVWADYLATSKIFVTCDCMNPEYEYDKMIREGFQGQDNHQLMWIRKPSTFTTVGVFAAYSNESSVGFYYAAAAFIVNIPAYGEGCRVFTE